MRHSASTLRPLLSRAYSTVSARPTPASIAAIETRWGKLPEAEQGAIADRLAVVEKGDWRNMTLDEKRAAYFIAYGEHGARNQKDPNLWKAVTAYCTAFFGIAVAGWFWWDTQKPKLRSTTPEWQAAQEARDVELKSNPFHGAATAEFRKGFTDGN